MPAPTSLSWRSSTRPRRLGCRPWPSVAAPSCWRGPAGAGRPSGRRPPPAPRRRPAEILAARHPVALTEDSRIRRAFAKSTISVNTIHHHQIADPGELEVAGTAPGGVIEAVEPRTEWACVGVQWHPEKMHESEQRVLFEQLVAQAAGVAA